MPAKKLITFRQCKTCKETKVREHDGKCSAASVSKRYVCDDGRYWNGSYCPDCHSKKLRRIQRLKALAKKERTRNEET